MSAEKARAKLFTDAAAGKPDVEAAVAAGVARGEAVAIADYYARSHTVPPVREPVMRPQSQEELPVMTAPETTPAQSFREGMEDFGTRAVGGITRGYDEDIAGWLGTLQGQPAMAGKQAQIARKAAAEQRSPGAALGGDIFGGAFAPGGLAGDAAATGLHAAVSGGSVGSFLKDMLAFGTISKLTKTKATTGVRSQQILSEAPSAATPVSVKVQPQQIISAKNMARPREEIVQSAMDMAKRGDKQGEIWRHPDLFDLPAPTPGAAVPVSAGYKRRYDLPAPASDQANYGSLKQMLEAQKGQRARDRIEDAAVAGKPSKFGIFGERRITPDEPLPPTPRTAEDTLASQMNLEAHMAKQGRGMSAEDLQALLVKHGLRK